MYIAVYELRNTNQDANPIAVLDLLPIDYRSYFCLVSERCIHIPTSERQISKPILELIQTEAIGHRFAIAGASGHCSLADRRVGVVWSNEQSALVVAFILLIRPFPEGLCPCFASLLIENRDLTPTC